MRVLLSAIVLLAMAPNALAQDTAPHVGYSSDALPGFGRVGLARTSPRAATIAATGSMGITESVLSSDDSHLRLSGRLGGAFQATEWFALGLQLDGRYDSHSAAGTSDNGLVGDPRVNLRVMHSLGALGLGAHARIWLPGGEAPSLQLDATTIELTGLLAYAAGDLELGLNAGYRIDNSAATVEDASLFSPADRVSLGVSDSNAVLLGVGAGYTAGALQFFGEWTWDLLIGDRAPDTSVSPMRVGAGIRMWLGDLRALQLEAGADILISSRQDPATSANVGLYSIEPRFQAHVGFALGFPDPEPAAPPPAPMCGDDTCDDNEDYQSCPADCEAPEVETGSVLVRVTNQSRQRLAGAAVELTVGETTVTAVSGGDGSFTAATVPVGAVTVRVTQDGYRENVSTVQVVEDLRAQTTVTLERDVPSGQVRGTVEDFDNNPIAANIVVDPVGTETTASEEDGSFELDVPPGRYTVIISADGFRQQRRPIRIELNGVTILNVNLRRN